jgi:hypothetical protein
MLHTLKDVELGSPFSETDTIKKCEMLQMFEVLRKYVHVSPAPLESFHTGHVSLLRLSLSTPSSLIPRTERVQFYGESLYRATRLPRAS